MTKVRPTASRMSGGRVERKVVYWNGCRKTCGAEIHEQDEEQHEDDDDRQALDPLEDRGLAGCAPWRADPQVLCCRSMRYSVSSTTVMSFGWISADDRAAVEHDQPVGDLVDVGEIVLDVDAGAAADSLMPPDEVEDLAHFVDGQRDGRLVEHDEVGVVVHGAADGDALALAAGEVARPSNRR